MDDGVSDPPASEGPTTLSEFFHEQFPTYLAMGMTADLYWNGDCTLVKAYRKAFSLKQKMDNEQLWLQGRYVYEAVCASSPLFNFFAKGEVSAMPYLEKPYDFDKKEDKPLTKEEESKKIAKGRVYMEVFMEDFNRKFDEEQKLKERGDTDGRGAGTEN